MPICRLNTIIVNLNDYYFVIIDMVVQELTKWPNFAQESPSGAFSVL